MNDVLNITFNNKTYYIYLYSSIEDLINLEELLKLPLINWKELLLKKNKTYNVQEFYKILLAKIIDNEKSVKKFIYKENFYWLNKDTRANIKNLLNTNLNNFLLVLPDKIVSIKSKDAIKFINDLEVFAYKCFITTLNHLHNIKTLKTVEDIINYDYTKGYPDKIILNGTELTNN